MHAMRDAWMPEPAWLRPTSLAALTLLATHRASPSGTICPTWHSFAARRTALHALDSWTAKGAPAFSISPRVLVDAAAGRARVRCEDRACRDAARDTCRRLPTRNMPAGESMAMTQTSQSPPTAERTEGRREFPLAQFTPFSLLFISLSLSQTCTASFTPLGA